MKCFFCYQFEKFQRRSEDVMRFIGFGRLYMLPNYVDGTNGCYACDKHKEEIKKALLNNPETEFFDDEERQRIQNWRKEYLGDTRELPMNFVKRCDYANA